MKIKHILIAFLLVLASLPALAVFKEKDLKRTLEVLLGELRTAYYYDVKARNTMAASRIASQHKELMELVETSNELSIILYSQPQDYTFDLTYALHQVTKQYEDFDKDRRPYDTIIENMSTELSRYSKLVQTLRNMPPVVTDSLSLPHSVTVLDSIDVSIDTLMGIPVFALREGFMLDDETAVLRDSCLALAEKMTEHYMNSIRLIEQDSQDYADTDKVLKEAYDYAQSRYNVVQRKVFLEGQREYTRILRSWNRYWRTAYNHLRAKYGSNENALISDWKGPTIVEYSLKMLGFLIATIILASLLVRLIVQWVPRLRTTYFSEHQGMIVSLICAVVFLIMFIVRAFEGSGGFIAFASRMMAEFTALMAAIFLSLLIRLDKAQTRAAVVLYLPTLILAFIVIFLRIIFIPNSALNLFFPPLVLLFTLWQLVANWKRLSRVPKSDRIFMYLSAFVMAAATALSWSGLVMMSVLVLIWWFFQLTILEGLIAIAILLDRYDDKTITRRKMNYRKLNPEIPISGDKGTFIEVTWAQDLLEMAIFPILSVWSLPVAVLLAGKVFNLSVVVLDFFFKPIVNVEGILHLSLFKVTLVISLFFLFRYLVYLIKAFYRIIRTRAVIGKMGKGVAFKESDINFNLANNIITLVCWGIYVMTVFILLKIPTSALAIITTGLATGIGFAMKDVLNNFFYGVQLMSGRVRVGDTIECEGIRGMVQSLSYQSTQVASEDGAIVAFSNTALFSKNFKNLTRNHQYEMINFTVGVKYGTDVEKARKVILEALQPLLGKDKYGHDVIDMKKGIAVRLRNFGDSSIDIQVLLYATVEAHYSFAAQAKEAIYNAFAANGIEIPFPQQDVYIKELPEGR